MNNFELSMHQPIENFFGNASFVLLFLSMISYWIQVAFSVKNISAFRFGRFIMIGANFCLLSLLILRWKESGHFPLSNLYESLMFLSWSLSTFHFILENIESNEFARLAPNHWLTPSQKQKRYVLNNKENKDHPVLFEQNLQMTEGIATSSAVPSGSLPKVFPTNNALKTPFIGALTAPAALFTNAFATFSLPNEMQHSSALVPALQSNWLMMHVTVMILSYSALICGSLLSIAFLIFTKNVDMDQNENEFSSKATIPSSNFFDFVFSNKNSENTEFVSSGSVLAKPLSFTSQIPFTQDTNLETTLNEKKANDGFTFQTTKDLEVQKNFAFLQQTNPGISLKKKLAENLDNLSYRVLGIGFPFLTIGILSGAVWANEAWGSYWSWDPKETWALATWLVFAIYLHTRLTKGWRGKKPALIASLGFVVVWICFLGVNLLGEGLHSYGFFK